MFQIATPQIFKRPFPAIAVALLTLCATPQTPLLAEKQPTEIHRVAYVIGNGHLGGDDGSRLSKYLQIVARVHQGWLSRGFRPAEQVDRACSLRPDMSPTRQMLIRAAVVDAYDAANALGLFTPDGLMMLKGYLGDEGGGSGAVTAYGGNSKGKQLKLVPYLSGPQNKIYADDLANWRLTVESEELSPDAKAELEKIAQNRKAMMDQAMAQEKDTRDQKHEARLEVKTDEADFEKEFATALAAANGQMAGASSLSMRAQVMETPNSRNGEKVTMEGQVSNSSTFPMNGKLEWYIVGRTPKKKKMVNLGSKTLDLKILPKAWFKFEAKSMGISGQEAKTRTGNLDGLTEPEKSEEPRYLGWLMRVTDLEGKTLVFKTSGLGELDKMAKDGDLSSLKMQTEENLGR